MTPAYTPTQLRSFLATLCGTLFGPTYTVYNSRFRLVAEDKYPTIRVGVSGGAEDDDSGETLNAVLMIAHGAGGTDFDGDGPDLNLMNRVDVDLLKLRNALNQNSLQTHCGAIQRISWDYGQSDESGRLLAWVMVSITFQRHVFYTDDVSPDDFDAVYIEDTVDVAATTVETEVTL